MEPIKIMHSGVSGKLKYPYLRGKTCFINSAYFAVNIKHTKDPTTRKVEKTSLLTRLNIFGSTFTEVSRILHIDLSDVYLDSMRLISIKSQLYLIVARRSSEFLSFFRIDLASFCVEPVQFQQLPENATTVSQRPGKATLESLSLEQLTAEIQRKLKLIQQNPVRPSPQMTAQNPPPAALMDTSLCQPIKTQEALGDTLADDIAGGLLTRRAMDFVPRLSDADRTLLTYRCSERYYSTPTEYTIIKRHRGLTDNSCDMASLHCHTLEAPSLPKSHALAEFDRKRGGKLTYSKLTASLGVRSAGALIDELLAKYPFKNIAASSPDSIQQDVCVTQSNGISKIVSRAEQAIYNARSGTVFCDIPFLPNLSSGDRKSLMLNGIIKRINYAAIFINPEEIFLCGGSTLPGADKYLNDCYIVNVASRTIRRVEDLPKPLDNFTLSCLGNTIVLLGGYGQEKGFHIYHYNIRQNTWSVKERPLEYKTRWSQSVYTIGNKCIFLFGGYSGVYHNDIWLYTPTEDKWLCILQDCYYPSRNTSAPEQLTASIPITRTAATSSTYSSMGLSIKNQRACCEDSIRMDDFINQRVNESHPYGVLSASHSEIVEFENKLEQMVTRQQKLDRKRLFSRYNGSPGLHYSDAMNAATSRISLRSGNNQRRNTFNEQGTATSLPVSAPGISRVRVSYEMLADASAKMNEQHSAMVSEDAFLQEKTLPSHSRRLRLTVPTLDDEQKTKESASSSALKCQKKPRLSMQIKVGTPLSVQDASSSSIGVVAPLLRKRGDCLIGSDKGTLYLIGGSVPEIDTIRIETVRSLAKQAMAESPELQCDAFQI